jgi:hypothetical protein
VHKGKGERRKEKGEKPCGVFYNSLLPTIILSRKGRKEKGERRKEKNDAVYSTTHFSLASY